MTYKPINRWFTELNSMVDRIPWRTDHGFQFAMLVIARWDSRIKGDGLIKCEAVQNITGIIQQSLETLYVISYLNILENDEVSNS